MLALALLFWGLLKGSPLVKALSFRWSFVLFTNFELYILNFASVKTVPLISF